MTDQLAALRSQIDELNTKLVHLLNKRAAIAQQIGQAKQGSAIYQPGREAKVLEQALAENTGPLSDSAVQAIFHEIIGACRNLEQQLRVAYLGPEGTYSEEAARLHCGTTCHFVSSESIDEAVHLVTNGKADVAVVPIENSTEGGVNRTLDILLETQLKICGEVALPIHHQLLSHATSLRHISEVIGHPQALAQCRQWLAAHLPNAHQVTASSNAEGAHQAAVRPTMAAIAGKRASELYKLPILSANIEDTSTNTTRFIVLGNKSATPTSADKTSLICSVPNKPGTLHQLVGVFAEHNINLIKLESRPAASKLWDYLFYIDIEGHAEDAVISQALQALETHTLFVKVLGSYPKAS